MNDINSKQVKVGDILKWTRKANGKAFCIGMVVSSKKEEIYRDREEQADVIYISVEVMVLKSYQNNWCAQKKGEITEYFINHEAFVVEKLS